MYYLLAFYLNHPKPNALHNIDITYDFGFLRGLAGFLTGMSIYQLYNKGAGRRFLSLAYLVVLIVLSAASYRYIERPARTAIRKAAD